MVRSSLEGRIFLSTLPKIEVHSKNFFECAPKSFAESKKNCTFGAVMRKILFTILLFGLVVCNSVAQGVLTERYQVTLLDLSAGLPHNNVNQFFVDSQGFVCTSLISHCAAYHMKGEDIYISHGYSVEHKGAAILVQRKIQWTADGWPSLK